MYITKEVREYVKNTLDDLYRTFTNDGELSKFIEEITSPLEQLIEIHKDCYNRVNGIELLDDGVTVFMLEIRDINYYYTSNQITKIVKTYATPEEISDIEDTAIQRKIERYPELAFSKPYQYTHHFLIHKEVKMDPYEGVNDLIKLIYRFAKEASEYNRNGRYQTDISVYDIAIGIIMTSIRDDKLTDRYLPSISRGLPNHLKELAYEVSDILLILSNKVTEDIINDPILYLCALLNRPYHVVTDILYVLAQYVDEDSYQKQSPSCQACEKNTR